ncbi:hypothetical protein H072_8666 [Dactylellina haptotyla CBS 200.50]|uniref:C2H2-type domain-containing protein n=1 Tax=Dactylellina haptotyla (strain CBS 200.50) TaxID=1284197 RepID=S8A3L7_DACHA|nr:hypothetical protein H072_8666 [Dactylellina haptotyla CBS 200.50]
MASSSRSSRHRPPVISCPLCMYTADDAHIIQLHFEAVHDNSLSPSRPEPPRRQQQQKYRISLAEDQDAYDPFKYQVPNNNSQEVVGHPVWKASRIEQQPPTRAAPRPPVPRSLPITPEPEPEYITCEWKDCGESINLRQLEEHLVMHEALMDEVMDDENDYLDEDLPSKHTLAGHRERRGDALMDAASKKRYIPKKEGASDRLRKKLGQMERRLESEAQAQDGELVMKPEEEDEEEDEDGVKVRKVSEDMESASLTDDDNMSTSKEYEIISKDEITEDDEGTAGSELGKSTGDIKPKHRSHHRHNRDERHSSKKLHKQGYGGYESTEPRKSSKKSSSNGSSWIHKPRFSKSELGPYANEKRMPEWLKDALKAGGKEVITKYIGSDGLVHVRKGYANETASLIPVIRQLLNLDPNVARAYLCHPCVKHVFKEHPAANGFCGYRNIQMLASYCRKVLIPGCERLFEERIPTVIQIQKWIENAWDMGINSHARDETGGILYTRKYIGSSEVEAMFTSFGTATIPRQFSEPNQQINALRHVLSYFSTGYEIDPDKVVQTEKAPIYFQHHGHSMTIVGIEQYKDGTLCLICFDPMFSPSQNIRSLIGQKRLRPNIAHAKLLKAFRRGGSYLKRYTVFEMVELAPSSEPEATLYE